MRRATFSRIQEKLRMIGVKCSKIFSTPSKGWFARKSDKFSQLG
jgi:hypothetical protein